MRYTPIKVGDRRTEQPQTFGDGRLMEGRVVYVHPTGRWYTVEFDLVPLIRRYVNYCGKHGRMVESKGKPYKIREAFFAPVAVPTEKWDNPRAGYRGKRCEA